MEYYDLLGLTDIECPLTDIQRAYRLQALKLHPDKNPNDQDATAKFHALAEAYAVLTDPRARELCNAKLRLEQQRRQRDAEMDDRRRLLKEQLLQKEAAVASRPVDLRPTAADSWADIKRKFNAELERIRKRQKLSTPPSLSELAKQDAVEDELHQRTLRVRWPSSSSNVSVEQLQLTFAKYGATKEASAVEQCQLIGQGMALLVCDCVETAINIVSRPSTQDALFATALVSDERRPQDFSFSKTRLERALPSLSRYKMTQLSASYSLADYEAKTFARLRSL